MSTQMTVRSINLCLWQNSAGWAEMGKVVIFEMPCITPLPKQGTVWGYRKSSRGPERPGGLRTSNTVGSTVHCSSHEDFPSRRKKTSFSTMDTDHGKSFKFLMWTVNKNIKVCCSVQQHIYYKKLRFRVHRIWGGCGFCRKTDRCVPSVRK